MIATHGLFYKLRPQKRTSFHRELMLFRFHSPINLYFCRPPLCLPKYPGHRQWCEYHDKIRRQSHIRTPSAPKAGKVSLRYLPRSQAPMHAAHTLRFPIFYSHTPRTGFLQFPPKQAQSSCLLPKTHDFLLSCMACHQQYRKRIFPPTAQNTVPRPKQASLPQNKISSPAQGRYA